MNTTSLKNETSELSSVEVPIEGMSCASCALTIENTLKKLNLGNVSVSVSFPLETAFITTNDEETLRKIILQINNLGYRTGEFDGINNERWRIIRLVICIILTAPLLLHDFLKGTFFHNASLQLAMTLPVVLIGLYEFSASALGALKNLRPNMDLLVLFGALSAFIYSLAGYLLNLGDNFLFFEAAASIITFMLMGSIIERRAVAKTSSSLRELLHLQPETARRIEITNSGENVNIVDARLLSKDDRILVNTGDKIPTDGIVYWGNGSVNESMLTGESTPAAKKIGDRVIGGSILTAGNIKLTAENVGEASMLSQIVKLVKKTQNERPPIQKVGDQVSAIFIPFVLIIAGSTFCYWYFAASLPFGMSFMRSLSVLVIACPCAMGLATPTAIAVALGRAAKNGILIKDSSIFEVMPFADTVIFDKTGTITTGNSGVTKLDILSNSNSGEVTAIIKSLEQHSSHPIAKILLNKYHGAATIQLSNIVEIPGVGVKATTVDGKEVAVGSYKITNDPGAHNLDENVFVTKNGEIIAKLSFDEELKNGALNTIGTLKEMKKNLVLLSGDTLKKCLFFASKVGITNDSVLAERSPQQKLDEIKKLTSQKRTVFIGDGINDSPALLASSVGIAAHQGTDLAISTAQIVLLKDDLNLIPKVFKLSQKTYSTIKQNLFWAFFYNTVAIPFAALGFLTPTIAALTMTFSDVVIVTNSLLLKIKKID